MPRHIKSISFEWNEGNITKSWKKHGISTEECEEVFLNRPLKIFDDKKHSEIETRFVSYGKTHNRILLTIIFTIRGKNIRVISARKQNKKERKIYENNTKI